MLLQVASTVRRADMENRRQVEERPLCPCESHSFSLCHFKDQKEKKKEKESLSSGLSLFKCEE
jgi:hypothetical protein